MTSNIFSSRATSALQTAGRTHVPVAALVLALLFTASCDTALPFDASECTEVLGDRCWTYLGPDLYVRSLAETPWGIFAGTVDAQAGVVAGIQQLDESSGAWQVRGLDHAMINTLLMVHGDTTRLLAGMVPLTNFGDLTEAAVFATEDAGETWLPWDGGLAAEYGGRRWAYSLTADPGNPNRLYWGMSNEILRSEDGGRNWEFVQGDPNAVMLANGVEDILVSPDRDGRIWAGARTGFGQAVIYRSHDWGNTWEYSIYGNYDNGIHRLAIDPNNTQRLWSGEWMARVRVSEDGGVIWNTSLSVPGPSSVSGLVVKNQRIYAVAWEVDLETSGNRLGFWVSSVGGNLWTSLPTPASALGATQMILADDGALLIATGRGIWRVSN